MNPFPMIEIAVRKLIEVKMPEAVGKVGGDLSYDGVADFYIWIGLVPGGGATETDGEWIVDIDVFATDYSDAMDRALALEALLIGSRHVTPTMRIDNCYQNQAPAERFWEDESIFRIGATYVFTARRSG